MHNCSQLDYHFIKTTGSGEGWAIAYYIFAGLKGIMLFTLIALIGTGWTFIKPFLSDKDKKIFLVVIPLQILDNIAMIVIEESAPGSQGWFTWVRHPYVAHCLQSPAERHFPPCRHNMLWRNPYSDNLVN
jgi:hypothetical protein